MRKKAEHCRNIINRRLFAKKRRKKQHFRNKIKQKIKMKNGNKKTKQEKITFVNA